MLGNEKYEEQIELIRKHFENISEEELNKNIEYVMKKAKGE